MKKAFTLAEVLITLGIIGVVAAMTLPALLNNKRNKELETALKKNTSSIGQALIFIQEQDGMAPTPLTLSARELKPKLMKNMKVIKDCGTGTEPAACVMNTGYDDTHLKKQNYKTFNRSREIDAYLIDDGQFVLGDGAMVLLENSVSNPPQTFITVDINGYKKGPNLWGHDLFTFDLIDNGKLLPMGAEGSHFIDDNIYCSKTSTSSLNGIGCTYKALFDKDYFRNL